MDLGLGGRVALVTGASKGIGKAIARGLVAEGVHVALLARSQTDLAQAAADITGAGRARVLPVPCDIRSGDAVRHAVSTLR